jgi:hypothetical protein
MDHGIRAWIALAVVIPLLLILVRVLKDALPEGVTKGWAWVAAAVVFLLADGRAGLLEQIGIDPRAAIKGVLLCGVILVLFEDCFDRVFRRPWF